MKKTIIQELSAAIDARLNCIEHNNKEWETTWTKEIREIQDNLPSGSGVDNGCEIDLDKSVGERIIIHTSYHHMNDGGCYDGWTDHTVMVTPAFDGFNVKIRGRDRNGIKDYLGDLFYESLAAHKGGES